MKLKLTERTRRITFHAVETWGRALRGTANRVAGMGYPDGAEAMRRDADNVDGDGADHVGLRDQLSEQASLFDAGKKTGALELTDFERRILYHALKHYRGEIENLRKSNEHHGHSSADQQRDLREIGELDEDLVPNGGLLKALWAAPATTTDGRQPDLAVVKD